MAERERFTLSSDMFDETVTRGYIDDDEPPLVGEEVGRMDPEEEQPPPPLDTWHYCEQASELEVDWVGSVRLATLSRVVVGSHVWCTYVFKLIHKDSPLPHQEGRKAVEGLRLLERGKRTRPRASDHTPSGYLDRMVGFTYKPIENVVAPTHPAVHVYTAGSGGEWLVYDFERRPECSNCHKPMMSLNGRSTRVLDNFRFRPCCYPAPIFHLLQPSATVDIARVVPVFYDLETTPTEDGVHELYMGIVSIPDELFATGAFENRLHKITSALEFMRVVDSVLAAVSSSSPPVEGKTSVQLVSFNGSRYDDLFLNQAWRNYVYQRWGPTALRGVEYSERKSALTFNTLTISEHLEVRWTDLARFVPPTSLKNLAKSFKLGVEKGSMPFTALNDFIRKGPDSVLREADGFLDTATYYGGNAEERQRSFDYYQLCVPFEHRGDHTKDLAIMCDEYCRQDVLVTEAAYHTLARMYRTYLADEATKSPFGEGKFEPMCLHSLATMAGKIMMASAAGSKSWGYNSYTKEELVSNWDIHCPRGPIYDFIRHALVGGWVKGYYQGLLVDRKNTPPDMLADIDKLTERHLSYVEDTGLEMTDIASMYPVAVTYPMPLGVGEWVEDEKEREELIRQVIEEDDPIKIHKFFVRCKWKAPAAPQFSESTLPQRANKTNSLRWTYWDDASGERIVTSLDLWIACRDHTGAGPDSVWKCYDATEVLFFPTSAQLYRPFMEACAKLKTDGTKSGNEEQRTIGKIAMNSAIGKLGQAVEARRNVLGDKAATDLAVEGGDNVRLVGSSNIHVEGGHQRPSLSETEYVFGVKDASRNMWPIHHSAFMYAATRLMRLNWSLLTRPPGTPGLLDQSLPDTLYGDTDSKLLAYNHSKLMPAELIGAEVGMFLPERECGLYTRPFFQVEPEKVSAAPTISILSGINTSKKYFVYGHNPHTDKGVLKFKCNGLTRFNEDKHPCPIHGKMLCAACRECPHGAPYTFECARCSLSMLVDETIVSERKSAEDGAWGIFAVGGGQRVYKYSLYDLPSLTFLDFLRVLVTGSSCKTVSTTFTRTLSLPTSKLPSFSVKTSLQARTLNRPALLCTLADVGCDKPSEGRMVPFVPGCAQLDILRGVLKPSGTYLLTSHVL